MGIEMRSETGGQRVGLIVFVALAGAVSLFVAGAWALAPKRPSASFDRAFDDPIAAPSRTTVAALPVEVCDWVIAANVTTVNGAGAFAGVQPGDTVCVTAGTRKPLEILNVTGSETDPITFINQGGQVLISGRRNNYAGIDIRNSQHLRISGTGESAVCGRKYPAATQECGFVVAETGRGVAATGRVSHLEIDHIEVTATDRSGMFIRSSDDTEDPRKSWEQRDTFLHDNYLHDVGTEGFYVGSSKYHEGNDPLLDGVEVGYNLVVGSGWDGLQVGSAVADCQIHHNVVIGSGQEEESDQQTGVINNRGSVCNIFNNLVEEVTGAGIYVQGNGGNQVYNNVVVATADGIVVTRGSNDDRSVFVWNNTIVDPARFGIRFRNDVGADNEIFNNLIVAPSGDAFIDTGGLPNVAVSHNLFLEGLEEAKVADPTAHDYGLMPGSPAIDAGLDLAGLLGDYPDRPRRLGKAIDIGAFEYMPTMAAAYG